MNDPEIIHAIATFMSRATLQGSEVNAYNAATLWLNKKLEEAATAATPKPNKSKPPTPGE